MSARSKTFPTGCPSPQCPESTTDDVDDVPGNFSEWRQRTRQKFPNVPLHGDGPFAVPLPCLRSSICLFLDPEVAAAAYRFSEALDFTCNGNCRLVESAMKLLLSEVATIQMQNGKVS